MTSNKTGLKAFLPTIIVILIVVAFNVAKVIPDTVRWINTRKEVQTLTQKLEIIKKEVEKNKEDADSAQVQFDAESKNYILEESQLFPEKFDPYYVSKTLELFSIQYSLLTATSRLRIERLSFSGGGGKTAVMLDMSCTEDTLKEIIKYFQSGDLPEAMVTNTNLDANDVEYLQSHKLPIAHIDSIRVSEANDSEIYKKISLKISFFTQN